MKAKSVECPNESLKQELSGKNDESSTRHESEEDGKVKLTTTDNNDPESSPKIPSGGLPSKEEASKPDSPNNVNPQSTSNPRGSQKTFDDPAAPVQADDKTNATGNPDASDASDENFLMHQTPEDPGVQQGQLIIEARKSMPTPPEKRVEGPFWRRTWTEEYSQYCTQHASWVSKHQGLIPTELQTLPKYRTNIWGLFIDNYTQWCKYATQWKNSNKT